METAPDDGSPVFSISGPLIDRLSVFVRLLSVVLLVGMASACSSNCEPNPEEGVYCEVLPTGS